MKIPLALDLDALPVTLRFDEPMSDDELLRFCADNDLLKVERTCTGEIVLMSPTGSGTGGVNADIIFELVGWNRKFALGIVFDSDTGFTLPDGSMLNPDAAWIARGRWDALSKRDKARFSPLCPDFLIELRSPGDRLAPLRAKMEAWIANGAQLAWLIDPELRQVTVYRPGEVPEMHQDPTSVHGSGCMSGFELVMPQIWG
jgi:Uma2 family endonuclease